MHGFFYDPHSGKPPATIDCNGTTITEFFGINNNQQIVGTCNSYTTGFVYDYVHGSFTTVDYPSEPETFLFGVNDGDQIVGRWDDPANQLQGGFTVTH